VYNYENISFWKNSLSDKNYSVVENPFLTKESIYKEPNNKNFDSVMASI